MLCVLCALCITTMLGPFPDFVNHVTVYCLIIGCMRQMREGKGDDWSDYSIRLFRCHVSPLQSRRTCGWMENGGWVQSTQSTPYLCLFLHSFQCMLARLAFSKDTRTASIGFTKKECLDRTMSCDLDYHKRERESYPSPFWLVSLTMHQLVSLSIFTQICHSCILMIHRKNGVS